MGTYVTKVQSFSEYNQSWVHACPTPHCIVGFYLSVVGFSSSHPTHPPPPSRFKASFPHEIIHCLSKHFLFNSHFVIQTILGIIALRNNKMCVTIKAPLFKSYTFPYYPSNWRLWKVIHCHRKKQKNPRHTRICNYRTKHLRLESKVRRWQSGKMSTIYEL